MGCNHPPQRVCVGAGPPARRGRGPLVVARRGFPGAVPGRRGPGQARVPAQTRSAFPSRVPGRDFSGLFQMRGYTADQETGATHAAARRAEISLPPPCVACVGNRINSEAGGLSVPLRHPSPVWGHPQPQRCAAELGRARSCRAPSRGAAYR